MKPKNKLPPWLRPKSTANAVHVVVGWYTADEWAKVKSSAMDPERFEATFSEWQAMAEEALFNMRAQGMEAKKHFIVASELQAWCLVKGKENDAASRAEFVLEQDRQAGERDPVQTR